MAIKFKKQQVEDFSEFIDTFTQKLVYEIEEQNPDILTALLKIFDQIHIVKSLREQELEDSDFEKIFKFLDNSFNKTSALSHHQSELVTSSVFAMICLASSTNFDNFLVFLDKKLKQVDESFHPILMARLLNEINPRRLNKSELIKENLNKYLDFYCNYPEFNSSKISNEDSIHGYPQAYRVLATISLFFNFDNTAKTMVKLSKTLFDDDGLFTFPIHVKRGCDDLNFIVSSFPIVYLENLDYIPRLSIADICLINGNEVILEKLGGLDHKPDYINCIKFLNKLVECNKLENFEIDRISEIISNIESKYLYVPPVNNKKAKFI